MSIKQFKRPIIAGLIVVFALAFFAGTASATEAKPCKEHSTTTTTAKPKATPTTTTVTPVRLNVPKGHSVAPKPAPSTTTTVEVAASEQIETTGEVNADDSLYDFPIQVEIVKSTTPTELAHTGIPVAPLALFAAALCAIGWVVLWLRSRVAV
jgi:hypothetical protein